MAAKNRANVQLPFLVYRLTYRHPVFDLGKLEDEAASAAYSAFRPWNIALENITFKEEPTNAAEVSTNFSLLGGKLVFGISPGGCNLFISNPVWSEAELLVNIAKAGIEAVTRATGAVVDRQIAGLTMHLTPTNGTIRDITANFVRIDTDKLPGGPIKSFGFSVYREDFTWVVDASVVYQNSLFVRMDHWFGAEVALEKVAGQLNDDETKILDLLGLEVD